MNCDYENRCGSCEYLKDIHDDYVLFEGPDNIKGHCIMLKALYYPDDYICHYYKDKNRCFITTAVCEILGFEKDNNILGTIVDFKNNYMLGNEEYQPLLDEYDVVGKAVADNLINDYKGKENIELVHCIYNFGILPTVNLILENKYQEAIDLYVEMTKSLCDHYGINIDKNVGGKNEKIREKTIYGRA